VRIKIADVAARANVSLITASRALSNPGLVAKETRTRVMEAAQALGYVPNRLARGLRNGKTQTIAVVTTGIQQRLNTLKLERTQREITRRGYHTLLLVRDSPEERGSSLVSACRGAVDGVVLCCLEGGPSAAEVRDLLATGLPVVSLEHFPDATLDVITADREQGARLAVEHLHRLGHTSIGLGVLTVDREVTERRVIGYRQAMADAGLEPHIERRSSSGLSLFEDGYRLIADAHDRGVCPTAWIFPDDEMAVGALRALADWQIRVPEDVAIIGWDNSPLCDYVMPRLTSIAQPVEAVVRRAVERLFARMEGAELTPEVVLITSELVVRESCGGR